MKVLPFKISKPNNEIFVYQEDHELVFYDKFHQHEEIQISYIVEGSGTLIVGDAINYYKKNDILVLGNNLPHVFKSDTSENIKSSMLTFFFTQNTFYKNLFNLEDLSELKCFFKKAESGFKLISYNDKIHKAFLKFKFNSNLDRFILFFKILKLINKSEHKILSSYNHKKEYSEIDDNRIRNIIEYTLENYQTNITLDIIASIAAMTKNAFCKYFKERTNKTYFKFLNRLRIEHACKLLLSNEDYSISEIAYKSGFKNISHFNRQFKAFKEKSPLKYKSANN